MSEPTIHTAIAAIQELQAKLKGMERTVAFNAEDAEAVRTAFAGVPGFKPVVSEYVPKGLVLIIKESALTALTTDIAIREGYALTGYAGAAERGVQGP